MRNNQACIMLKAHGLIKQLHINLQHFPRHEKRALYTFSKAVKQLKLDSIVSCLGHAKSTASYSGMLKKALSTSLVFPYSLINPTRSI